MTDLADIRTMVRQVTGRPSPNQISDANIDEKINNFYLYDLPAYLKLFNLKTTYSFVTEPDVDTYDFPANTFTNIEPPIYIAGYEVNLIQSREQFYNLHPRSMRNETLDTGTGAAGPYGGTVIGTPVLKSDVLISTVDNAGNALSAEDNGLGVFTGDIGAGATINYETGVIAGITWTGIIAAGETIRVQYINYAASRPFDVLFYDDVLTLRPVPDQAYTVEVNAFISPTALIADADEPLLREWWELLAYGAALKIFADNLDMEAYGQVEILFNRRLRLIERRTLTQLKNQRASTIYSDGITGRNPFRYQG